MQIKAEDLKDAVEVLQRIPVSAAIKQSQFVEVRGVEDGLELRAQCEAFARFTVPCTGKPDFKSFRLERASFFPFVNAAAGTIDVETVKGKLVWKQGRRRAVYTDVDTGRYQSFTVPDTVVKLDAEQLALVQAARRYALDDVGEPRFNCVMVDHKTIMGASHVAVFKATTKDTGVKVPLSLFVCDLLDKWKPALRATATATAAVFTTGAIYHPLSSVCMSEFPGEALSERIKAAGKGPVQFAAKAGRLLEALRTVKSIAAGSVVDDMVVSVRPAADKITLTVSGQAVNIAETVKAAQVTATATEDLLLVSVLPFIQFAADQKAEDYLEFVYTQKSGYLLRFGNHCILAARRDTKK